MTGKEAGDTGAGEPSLQGATFVPQSQGELFAAIERAFDYRGDVTLGLDGGREVSGYLFNRVLSPPDPFVDLLPQDSDEKRRVRCAEVRSVRFTGRDMASGRSWEAWIQRWNDKRQALARGQDVGDIEPKPTHLA